MIGTSYLRHTDSCDKAVMQMQEEHVDIIVETDDIDQGLIIEVKSADRITELESACERAMAQIHDLRYDESLRNNGRDDIWAYGIAFYKKRCRVVARKL